MDKYRKIVELMQGFRATGQVFIPATVESVEGNTCTVAVDGLSIADVRLSATTDINVNRVLLIPQVGSSVLIASQSGDYSNLFVLHVDIVDQIEVTCNGENLMLAISKLISALSGTLQLTTSAGPATGTFSPATLAQLNAVETSFKKILK